MPPLNSSSTGRVDVKHPDADVLEGFPNHGDPLNDTDPSDEPAPVSAPAPVSVPSDDLRALQARLDRQEAELAHLRRLQPAPAPAPAPAPTPPTDETDWDQEFFTSPKKALEKYANVVEERVTQKLTASYQRDRSTQTFWDQFYDKHPDLKQDHDLVDLTLKSNLAEMGSMPVGAAMDRLADLTRDRILRYAGGSKARNPKVKVEGASPPKAPATSAKPQEEKILSITDIIRRNRRKRLAAGA